MEILRIKDKGDKGIKEPESGCMSTGVLPIHTAHGQTRKHI